MLTGPVTVRIGVAAAALPLVGLIVGLVATRIALRHTRRTEHHAAAVAIAAIREVVVVWLVIAGAYGSIVLLPLNRDTDLLARKVLTVLLLASATIVAARLAVAGVRRFALRADGGEAAYGSIFLNITRVLIFVLGFLVILQSLNISITPILTALGVGGLAVALALEDTLANLFAGIHIIASKYVKGGDYVRLETGDQGYIEGYIADINWRHTSLHQLRENMILVPNSTLASTIVTNYARPERAMEVPVEVGVSYDSDLEKVEEVTIDVAEQVLEEIAPMNGDFEPWIWYESFGDYAINFIVYLQVREFEDQYPLRHEFIKRLHKRYAAEGIEIPFPVQEVHWKGAEGNGHNGGPAFRQPARSGPLRQLLRRSNR